MIKQFFRDFWPVVAALGVLGVFLWLVLAVFLQLSRFTMIRVVNLYKESYDVYIGRGSPWGNPFKIGVDGTREEVIAKYEQWIQTQPHLLSRLHELKNKTLGCFCCPKPCHGNVLAKLAE